MNSMENVKLPIASTCYFIIIILLCVTGSADGRGGRGGGGRGRGGSRGSRSSRSSGSRGIRVGGQSWRTAMTSGSLYGSFSYMRRSRYIDDPNDEPEICYNAHDKDNNGSAYKYFICPLPGQSEDDDYCCGDANREYCCKFFDDPGRTAGASIGIILLCLLILAGGVCIFLKCRRQSVAKVV